MDIKKLENIPVVDCGTFVLRAIGIQDAQDMYEYAGDDEVTAKLSWPSHRSVEDTKRSIYENFLTRPERGLPNAYAIVWKENNKMIGTCDFWHVDFKNSCGEIGYVINKEYWNKGIVTRALKELIKFGFEYLELERIQIAHATDNPSSKRVIEKCDFRFEGLTRYSEKRKTGEFVDHKIYSILKGEYNRKELSWQ